MLGPAPKNLSDSNSTPSGHYFKRKLADGLEISLFSYRWVYGLKTRLDILYAYYHQYVPR